MSLTLEQSPPEPPAAPPRPPRRKRRTSPMASGNAMVWTTAGSLSLCLIAIVGLLLLCFVKGSSTFWQQPIQHFELVDGTSVMGEVTRDEVFTTEDGVELRRRLLRVGNYEFTGEHFRWVSENEIRTETTPEWALVLERRGALERTQAGPFYGTPEGIEIDGEVVAAEPEEIWKRFNELHGDSVARQVRRQELEKHEVGATNRLSEEARIELRKVEMAHGEDSPEWAAEKPEYERVVADATRQYGQVRAQIDDLNDENMRVRLLMRTANGDEQSTPLADVVRAVPANQLSLLQSVGVYTSRWWEFLADEPREANSAGGVFPAIFGTIAMTLIMTIMVVPFGVLAALYMKEYAKQGFLISAVRIAVNNLAGVPSIVFGVFGLGFFCYFVGVTVDELFFQANAPNPTFGKGGILWASLTLALLTLPVVIVATEEALSAVPNSMREGSYACGATKWQTIRRIVLPRALPGIMTGVILAISRGAGEVAPLMLVGAVKLAPELPVDGVFPYVHAQRSFMHLGFHIYDLGFQSQNSEAAKPMVFTTTLLLIAIIVLLNVVAIRVRTRLRARFSTSHI
jgi:phosphate transport system permease protein